MWGGSVVYCLAQFATLMQFWVALKKLLNAQTIATKYFLPSYTEVLRVRKYPENLKNLE